MLNRPIFFFLPAILCLWAATQLGVYLRRRRPLQDIERDDFGVIQAATLTLLALIIGFSFSMATSRYDLRKNYEEAEANAISTEWVRARLLPAADRAKIRSQLRRYTDLRIAFYRTRDEDELRKINDETGNLQDEMWLAVETPALSQPTPVAALAVSGMNDVLNSQGYTQAAWWNQIPLSAWSLLIITAISCHVLVGYGVRGEKVGSVLLLALPLVVAISFLLIADIDAPRGGLIRVKPQNLVAVADSFKTTGRNH
jgi:hypothetical protein